MAALTRNFLGIRPGRVGPNLEDGRRQSQIGHVVGIEFFGRHRQAGIDAITPLMRSNGIALGGVSDGANDGRTDDRIGMAPRDWNGIDAKGVRMCRQGNVIGIRKFGLRDGGVWSVKRQRQERNDECEQKQKQNRSYGIPSLTAVPFSFLAFLFGGGPT